MITRRDLLSSAGAAALVRSNKPAEHTWIFVAPGYKVRLSVEYFDHYVSSHFNFKETVDDTHFCLGADGKSNRDCLHDFVGSLALVHFQVTPFSRQPDGGVLLLERVRMIDHHERLPERKVFEQTIQLNEGLGSDIQAFGYEAKSLADQATDDHDDTWCLMRQDLYLNDPSHRLLIANWKQTLSAVRLLDIIPEPGVRVDHLTP